MTNGDFHCIEHSAVCAEIQNIKDDVKEMKKQMNMIFTRLNIILGGTAVACFMLVLNIVLKTM